MREYQITVYEKTKRYYSVEANTAKEALAKWEEDPEEYYDDHEPFGDFSKPQIRQIKPDTKGPAPE